MQVSGQNPKVTVLMSVYNGEKYLSEAVDSILAQTYRNFEFLIVDDGSSDGSSEILAVYAELDSRIRVVRNDENIGLTRSLNKGLSLASGEYIARMDADDVAYPTRLACQTEYLDNNPGITVVGSGIEIIDENSQVIGRRLPKDDSVFLKNNLILKNSVFAHSSVVFRREVVVRAGGYDENFRYAQDYDLWSRLAEKYELGTIEEAMMKWRSISSNISASKRTEQLECILQISERNLVNAFPDIDINLQAYEHIFLSIHGHMEYYIDGDIDRLAPLWTALMPAGKDIKEFGRGLSECGYSLIARGHLGDGRKMTQIAGKVFGIEESRIKFIKSLLKNYFKRAQ